MNADDILDVVSPVETPSGKTIWMKLGVAFKGDANGKYLYKMSLMTLPVTAFSGNPLELFMFKPNPDQKKKHSTPYSATPPDDRDIPPPDDDIWLPF
jgi:hypothetical protein